MPKSSTASPPNGNVNQKVKWKEITRAVQKLLPEFAAQGFKPTLRGMFYRLFSLKHIPNTKNSYTSFGKEMVKARLDGRLPIDCFEDTSRRSYADFNEVYLPPEQIIDVRIDQVKNTVNDYKDFIPRWEGQPHYVEVWIEKEAMANTFVAILQALQVRVVPNRGNTSLTFLNENIQRLKKKQQEGKAVHILSYGDLDPSGDYMMALDIPKRMKDLDFDSKVNGGSYEIVAVTEKQIHEHNLPWDPDAPTRAKIENDSKLSYYSRKYDELYAVELDALPAIIPEIFRDQLIIGRVEQYFNEEIYNNLRNEYNERDVLKILKDRIKGLKI